MYPQSEILFPHHHVAALKKLRAAPWQELTTRIAILPDGETDSVAFSLMMIRLCDCLTCDLGSYKAQLGCAACAQRTVQGVKGPDKILLEKFEQARTEVVQYLGISTPEQG